MKKPRLSVDTKMWLAIDLTFLLYHQLGEFSHNDASKFARELVGIIESKLENQNKSKEKYG